ncbi:hypothetical protein ACJMK2_044600 [Sinanodonta woodiana]|uniref:Uncharacterized protein n=1 Tax=Sinanodonta woodiana TaxID=1069815 RepID=A0ABD3W0J6_SINWO
MTETSSTATSTKRKEIEDEMERVSAELRELAETNKVFTERLQTFSLKKPNEIFLQICPVCHCKRKSDKQCQAPESSILVLKENEKERQQEIKLLNRTFIDIISRLDNLITRDKSHVQGSNDLVETKTGIFLSNSAADTKGDNATSSPSEGQTMVDTSSVKVKTASRNSAMKKSLNADIAPNITCYGDDYDSVDEDGSDIAYQKPKILPNATENKTSRLTLQNPNFGPKKVQGNSNEGRDNKEAHRADTAKDECPELIPRQTKTILVPGIPQSYWGELAMSEAGAGPKEKVGKICTVLCLDISSSMAESRAWYQATTFIRDFIAGMEHSFQERDITEESVALCVFGHEVKIVQRLTNRFSLLTTALGQLKVGGPSPLFGGLLMSFAGLRDHSSCQANNIRIFARIILISDGKPSSEEILAGPDIASGTQMEESAILGTVKSIADKEVRLHCVPVGNANQALLEKLATMSKGTVYPYTAGRKVAKKLANTLHAGSVLRHLKILHSLPKPGDLDENKSFTEVIKSSDFITRMTIEGFMEIACNSEEEKEEVYAIAKEAVKEGLFENEESNKSYEKYHIEIPDVNLPPLGSRVRRGPDWDKDSQDGNGPGTVVGHVLGSKSVYVTWDNTLTCKKYRCGEGGVYDVLLVDEPRVLKENELIQVGCLVKRGPDWIYEDQDGAPGAKGVVLRVLDDGRVIVRWPHDQSKAYYRFGADGCFDLEICAPNFGGQGHTLRDVASATNVTTSRFGGQGFTTSRFGGQGFTLGGLSSASGNHSSQNVGNKNSKSRNKNYKVKTLFS